MKLVIWFKKYVLAYYKGAKGKEIYFIVEKDSAINTLDGTGKGLNMDGPADNLWVILHTSNSGENINKVKSIRSPTNQGRRELVI